MSTRHIPERDDRPERNTRSRPEYHNACNEEKGWMSAYRPHPLRFFGSWKDYQKMVKFKDVPLSNIDLINWC